MKLVGVGLVMLLFHQNGYPHSWERNAHARATLGGRLKGRCGGCEGVATRDLREIARSPVVIGLLGRGVDCRGPLSGKGVSEVGVTG